MAKHTEHIIEEHSIGEDFELDLEEFAPVPISGAALDEAKELEQALEITPLSPLELQIAEERLNNVTPTDISKRLGLPIKVVRSVLARQNVRAYIKDITEAITSSNKDIRIQLMAAIIEKKIAEEGLTSDLDLATLLKMQDDMGKVKEQADLGNQGNVMVNILNSITKGN